MTKKKCQSVLTNPRDTYSARKRSAEYVARIYDKTPYFEYGGKIKACAESMIVRSYEGGAEEIVHTLFCGSRHCPICQHRRALKTYVQLSKILDYLEERRKSAGKNPYQYILITLTMLNCSAEDLPELLQHFVESFTRLTRCYEWKNAIKGCWRTLEITYNKADYTLHPHFHVLCAVNPSYFNSNAYLKHADILRIWKRALKVAYDPDVDIRRVKEKEKPENLSKDETSKNGAFAEVSKYITKPFDDLSDVDEEIAAYLLEALHFSLKGKKQFINYGVFREAQRALHLSDEDGDLLDVTDGDEKLLSELRPDVEYVLKLLNFHRSIGKYVVVEDLTHMEDGGMLGMVTRRMDYELTQQAIQEGIISTNEAFRAKFNANAPRLPHHEINLDKVVENILCAGDAYINK